MLLAEDLLLLLYDDESGKRILGREQTRWVLTGAVLMELAMAGRVDVTAKRRLVVRDATPTGDPVLDDRLAILADKPGVRLTEAMERFARKLRPALLDRLAGKGMLQAERQRALGLIPVTRWPARDVSHEFEVLTTLDKVLCAGAEPDERTAALIAMLDAAGAVPAVVASAVDKTAVSRRAQQIAWSAWAADDARRAVHAIRIQTMIAVDIASGAGAVP